MIIALVGPTGVGKTEMSIKLAKKYDGIIINFDSVQIYRGLNIGSAKITDNEKKGIAHYLLDIKNPDEDYTVKDYQTDARKILKKYENRNIILVGGTGLYLCAALMDYRFDDESTVNNYESLSNDELYDLALKKDPNVQIHKNNRVRLVRFLNKQNVNNIEPKLLYNNVKFIGLTSSRQNIYTRVNERVDKMLNNGLIEEARKLYDNYPDSRILNSAIGYKELISYFKKEIDLDTAIKHIKQNSRHYVKRQYTWFNNKINAKWFDANYEDFDKTVEEVVNYLS